MTSHVFIKVTNKDIYVEIKSLRQELEKLNQIKQEVSFHRKWLYSLTGAFSTGFLFIIGFLLRR